MFISSFIRAISYLKYEINNYNTNHCVSSPDISLFHFFHLVSRLEKFSRQEINGKGGRRDQKKGGEIVSSEFLLLVRDQISCLCEIGKFHISNCSIIYYWHTRPTN